VPDVRRSDKQGIINSFLSAAEMRHAKHKKISSPSMGEDDGGGDTIIFIKQCCRSRTAGQDKITTQFSPPNGLGARSAQRGSSCHCPSTTNLYS
jgi:hypothetical protein